MTDLVAIGVIRTAWGLEGWLKLTSFSGEWDHFAGLERIDLLDTRKGSSREYRVEGFRMHQGLGMFKLAGVDTPEAGKLLAGREILVPRDAAAPLGEDEWYLSDLQGLSLVEPDGTPIGTVAGVIEAADDLLEIDRPDGSRFMVPFRAAFVGEPNLADRTIELKAPWLAE